MNRAKVFADAFNGESNVLHVFDDGYVVAVACSPGRHLTIRDHLKKEWPTVEEARSDNGFLGVFVVPAEVPLPSNEFPPMLVVLTHGFNDHRYSDWNTLGSVVGLLTKLKEGTAIRAVSW